MSDTAPARAYAKQNIKKVLILENHLHLVLVNVRKYLHALKCLHIIYSCTVICFVMGISSYSLFVFARYYIHGS